MVDFDESDHPCRILIIWGSRSGKTDSWFNLANYQPDIDKIIYMHKIHMKQNIYFQLTNEKVNA